jgi:hypothetical protein
MEIVKKHVKIKLITELLGTVPMDKEVYATYIASLKPVTETEDEIETVDSREERGWTSFHRDANGLLVYDYFIKGFFKNAGNVLKEELKIKNLRSKLSDLFFIQPRKIYLGKKKPDGVIERPLRAQTAQGPRVTLARSDYIAAGTEIEFDVALLQGKGELKDGIIAQLLEYGQLQGLGQFRNGGYGRFEVVSIKKA